MQRHHAAGAVLAVLLVTTVSYVLRVEHCSKFVLRLACSAALSVLGFLATCRLIPPFMVKLKGRGLCGKDLNKVGLKGIPEEQLVVPESLGIVAGAVFMTVAIFGQGMFSQSPEKLLEYNAGLLSICFMIFLGFADDVLDLPWRYKMTLPTFASLPLLLAYSGGTSILIPSFLRPYLFGPETNLLNLGYAYHLYMGLLAVFCTNSINILAGVNGLEVGQSVVIAAFVALHNLTELCCHIPSTLNGAAPHEIAQAELAQSQHLFSLLLTLPFLAVSLGLLAFNWHPSKVFVGDTYTYFAGMFFAVCGILGHFGKTLLLFFIPQVLNFLLSLPQLLGFVHCPRHRLPKLDPATGLLHATPNYTLINLTLRLLGPQRERDLTVMLLAFQVGCCALGLAVRYSVLGLLFV